MTTVIDDTLIRTVDRSEVVQKAVARGVSIEGMRWRRHVLAIEGKGPDL